MSIQTINSFNELSQHLIPKAYLPGITDVSFKRKRSWFTNRIKRSSQNVKGLEVFIDFITEIPWSWRSMSEMGFLPTGSKFSSAEQSAALSCSAASAIVSLHEIEATKGDPARWNDIIGKQMKALYTCFPYYVRALLWTSQNANKALGKVGSVVANVVTLNNTGLWNSVQKDAAKLFEKGMFLQAYRSTAKVGTPVKVTKVDRTLGKVTLSADPGLAAGDALVVSDIGGLDQPFSNLCPGIFDVIDDDNIFQGMDRSAAGGDQFSAIIEDSVGALTYEKVNSFLHAMYSPDIAVTSWELLQAYYTGNFQSNTRFEQGGSFVDGYEYIQIGKTKLLEDDDVDSDKIIVPDLDNMRIADRGGVENLFNEGWKQVPGRPFLEYHVVWFMLLLAEDCRYMGAMKGITY